MDLPDDESKTKKENIDINEKDTEKRTNERTNERANEWKSEQKFMNEILSKNREIEENSLFRCDNWLFRQFLQNIGNCYQLHFMWKNKRYKEKVQWKCAKTAISGIFPTFSAGKRFFLKIRLGHVLAITITLFLTENQ